MHIDQRRESTSWNSLESFINFTWSCNSCIWRGELINSNLAFYQSSFREFINSHFLSSFQFFHVMNTSDMRDMSFSKCSFSFCQFFVQLGLISSWLFLPNIRMINLHTIGLNSSIKFTNRRFNKTPSACLLQHFCFCLREHLVSLLFKKHSCLVFSDSESLNNASFLLELPVERCATLD